MRRTMTQKIICVVVATLFLMNDLCYGLGISPASTRATTIQSITAAYLQKAAENNTTGLLPVIDRIFIDSVLNKASEDILSQRGVKFITPTYSKLPDTWKNDPIYQKIDLVSALRYWYYKKMDVSENELAIISGCGPAEKDKNTFTMWHPEKFEDGTYVIVVNPVADEMWRYLRKNDVWFEFDAGNGNTRTASVAYGLLFSLLTEGGKYPSVNNAIKKWFSASPCFKDATRYNNENLLNLLSKDTDKDLFAMALAHQINKKIFEAGRLAIEDFKVDEKYQTEYKVRRAVRNLKGISEDPFTIRIRDDGSVIEDKPAKQKKQQPKQLPAERKIKQQPVAKQVQAEQSAKTQNSTAQYILMSPQDLRKEVEELTRSLSQLDSESRSLTRELREENDPSRRQELEDKQADLEKQISDLTEQQTVAAKELARKEGTFITPEGLEPNGRETTLAQSQDRAAATSGTDVARSGKVEKYVYFFGDGKADGNESMKDLLGGKGANLAEMAGHPELRLPVPPGFTITTEGCTYYYRNNKEYPAGVKEEVEIALGRVEKLMGKAFGDPDNPLLVSVRSGARRSMPGMMETVLNVGLTEKTIPGLIKLTGSERFVYDAYRRLIMMYSDVVMEKAEGIEPRDMGIRRQLEAIMDELKKEKGYESDTDLKVEDLKKLCGLFKERVKSSLGKSFPDDPYEQLWGGIGAVFASWNGKRAVSYRRIENIPDDWGTAVTVQAMVFGNMGDDSATGVAFTRNPGNGENKFYGEYLINAQGEDVVAGIRTPAPINKESKSDRDNELKDTLEEVMPDVYKELHGIQQRLEKHYEDMLDIEFTIEKGRLFMLQCRVGKRNGPAAVRIAVDMVKEGLITKEQAVMRVTPAQLEEFLYQIIDPTIERGSRLIANGSPAGPGAGVGRAVFTPKDAIDWAARGEKVILVREETSPEDVDGMHKAQAILTSKGGMTSHAALVARGWGKTCIVGAGAIHIDEKKKQFIAAGTVVKEGDWITLNGTKGNVYLGKLPLIQPDIENNVNFMEFMKICDSVKRLKVMANADTPKDAAQALRFGAEGIGLFRTEHMFYGQGSDKPLFLLRKMIMSKTEAERRKALDELFPFVKSDMKAALEVMKGHPVTIRLLDPPLHEFVPHDEERLKGLAEELGIDMSELGLRAEALGENNPMLGHRGVRLGITYPEITEMQVRAIFEAAAEIIKSGGQADPEIMIPVTSAKSELDNQKVIVDRVHKEVLAKFGLKKLDFLYGTMIEIPRAALQAGSMAHAAEFFSFGTNDLTQMTFGFSRDDIGSFLPDYLEKGILPKDPFQSIDQEGVGQLIALAIERGRKANPNLEIGICGEHGGDPDSIEFFNKVGMDYVSCSPFRVPIARLAAAQAAVTQLGKQTVKEPQAKQPEQPAEPAETTTASKLTEAQLKTISGILQKDIIEMLAKAGSGHPGGSLSMIDMVTALYFGGLMRYDPKDSNWVNRDRFVLSKGHAAPGLYAALGELGFFNKQGEFPKLRQLGGMLQGHTDMTTTPGVDMSAGSIGVAFSAAEGMAIAAKMDDRDYITFCMLGDGEIQEGQVDETARHASVMGLDNLIAFIDWNGMQIDGRVTNVDIDYEAQGELWQARGWNVIKVNGNDVVAVIKAGERAKSIKNGKPTLILAKTEKGLGLPGMASHGSIPKEPEVKAAIDAIDNSLVKLGVEPSYIGKAVEDINSKIKLSNSQKRFIDSQNTKRASARIEKLLSITKAATSVPAYAPDAKIATRTAGEDEQLSLGIEDINAIAICADLKGSVMMNKFEKAFGTFSKDNPLGRYIGVGIREDLMPSLAAGLATCGKVSIVGTFAVFTPRMKDQVKAILKAKLPLVIVGTHVGLAVGPDGDTHQDSDSAGIFAQMPNVKIYEAADAEEAKLLYRLAYENAKRDGGVHYVRLARPNTPILVKPEGWQEGAKKGFYPIYAPEAQKVTIVSSGVATIDAIDASKDLTEKGIFANVIDVTQLREIVSSQKNMDDFAKLIQGSKYVITVADQLPHILEDKINKVIVEKGFGEIIKVIPLGIQNFGESGDPKALYAKHGFDKDGIVKAALTAVNAGVAAKIFINKIIEDLQSGNPKVRLETVQKIGEFNPNLGGKISTHFASLPISGKAILDAAKKLGKPVLACNIDNGELSAMHQIKAMMEAALGKDAYIIFEVGPGALKTYADGKPQLPEYCARAAKELFEKTGKQVIYAVHLDHNQIDNKKFQKDSKIALQEAIDRAKKALKDGFTSFATDTSTITDESVKLQDFAAEEGYLQARLKNVIETGAEILKAIYEGAGELGIEVGNEGEVGDVGKDLSTFAEAKYYYLEIQKRLIETGKKLGVDFTKTPWMDVIAAQLGTSHGYEFDGKDKIRPYEGGKITADDYYGRDPKTGAIDKDRKKKGVVLDRAAEIAREFNERFGIDMGVALHGYSGTPLEAAPLFIGTGIAKVNINTDWQAITWKVLRAYDEKFYKKCFEFSLKTALDVLDKMKKQEAEEKDSGKKKTLNEKINKLQALTSLPFEQSKNRIIFGKEGAPGLRTLFRGKEGWRLLEEITKALMKEDVKMSLPEKQDGQDILDVKLTCAPDKNGLTAQQAIHRLTKERVIDLIEALKLKNSAETIRDVERSRELRLQDWQIEEIKKELTQPTEQKIEKPVTKSEPISTWQNIYGGAEYITSSAVTNNIMAADSGIGTALTRLQAEVESLISSEDIESFNARLITDKIVIKIPVALNLVKKIQESVWLSEVTIGDESKKFLITSRTGGRQIALITDIKPTQPADGGQSAESVAKLAREQSAEWTVNYILGLSTGSEALLAVIEALMTYNPEKLGSILRLLKYWLNAEGTKVQDPRLTWEFVDEQMAKYTKTQRPVTVPDGKEKTLPYHLTDIDKIRESVSGGMSAQELVDLVMEQPNEHLAAIVVINELEKSIINDKKDDDARTLTEFFSLLIKRLETAKPKNEDLTVEDVQKSQKLSYLLLEPSKPAKSSYIGITEPSIDATGESKKLTQAEVELLPREMRAFLFNRAFNHQLKRLAKNKAGQFQIASECAKLVEILDSFEGRYHRVMNLWYKSDLRKDFIIQDRKRLLDLLNDAETADEAIANIAIAKSITASVKSQLGNNQYSYSGKASDAWSRVDNVLVSLDLPGLVNKTKAIQLGHATSKVVAGERLAFLSIGKGSDFSVRKENITISGDVMVYAPKIEIVSSAFTITKKIEPTEAAVPDDKEVAPPESAKLVSASAEDAADEIVTGFKDGDYIISISRGKEIVIYNHKTDESVEDVSDIPYYLKSTSGENGLFSVTAWSNETDKPVPGLKNIAASDFKKMYKYLVIWDKDSTPNVYSFETGKPLEILPPDMGIDHVQMPEQKNGDNDFPLPYRNDSPRDLMLTSDGQMTGISNFTIEQFIETFVPKYHQKKKTEEVLKVLRGALRPEQKELSDEAILGYNFNRLMSESDSTSWFDGKPGYELRQLLINPIIKRAQTERNGVVNIPKAVANASTVSAIESPDTVIPLLKLLGFILAEGGHLDELYKELINKSKPRALADPKMMETCMRIIKNRFIKHVLQLFASGSITIVDYEKGLKGTPILEADVFNDIGLKPFRGKLGFTSGIIRIMGNHSLFENNAQAQYELQYAAAEEILAHFLNTNVRGVFPHSEVNKLSRLLMEGVEKQEAYLVGFAGNIDNAKRIAARIKDASTEKIPLDKKINAQKPLDLLLPAEDEAPAEAEKPSQPFDENIFNREIAQIKQFFKDNNINITGETIHTNKEIMTVKLFLSRANVRDISGLKGLTTVKELWLCGNNELTDIKAAETMPSLKELWLDDTKIPAEQVFKLLQNRHDKYGSHDKFQIMGVEVWPGIIVAVSYDNMERYNRPQPVYKTPQKVATAASVTTPVAEASADSVKSPKPEKKGFFNKHKGQDSGESAAVVVGKKTPGRPVEPGKNPHDLFTKVIANTPSLRYQRFTFRKFFKIYTDLVNKPVAKTTLMNDLKALSPSLLSIENVNGELVFEVTIRGLGELNTSITTITAAWDIVHLEDISAALMTVLRQKLNVQTIGDLQKLTYEDLVQTRGVGENGAIKIQNALSEKGFDLKEVTPQTLGQTERQESGRGAKVVDAAKRGEKIVGDEEARIETGRSGIPVEMLSETFVIGKDGEPIATLLADDSGLGESSGFVDDYPTAEKLAAMGRAGAHEEHSLITTIPVSDGKQSPAQTPASQYNTRLGWTKIKTQATIAWEYGSHARPSDTLRRILNEIRKAGRGHVTLRISNEKTNKSDRRDIPLSPAVEITLGGMVELNLSYGDTVQITMEGRLPNLKELVDVIKQCMEDPRVNEATVEIQDEYINSILKSLGAKQVSPETPAERANHAARLDKWATERKAREAQVEQAQTVDKKAPQEPKQTEEQKFGVQMTPKTMTTNVNKLKEKLQKATAAAEDVELIRVIENVEVPRGLKGWQDANLIKTLPNKDSKDILQFVKQLHGQPIDQQGKIVQPEEKIDRIEIFLPDSVSISSTVGISLILERAIRRENEAHKKFMKNDGRKEEDIVVCRPLYKNPQDLERMLEIPPEKGVRRVVVIDEEFKGKDDAAINSEIDKYLGKFNDRSCFNKARVINVKLPDDYKEMSENNKAFYQADLVMRSQAIGLISKDSSSPAKRVLAAMLEGYLKGDKNDIDSFIENLTRENDPSWPVDERLRYFLGKTVSLLPEFIRQFEVHKLRMSTLWAA